VLTTAYQEIALTPDTQIYDIDGYLNGRTTTDDNRRTIASRKSTRMLPRCDHQVYAKSALKFSPRVCEWPICGDAADPFVRCRERPFGYRELDPDDIAALGPAVEAVAPPST
jgi:hypothetical protein